MKNINFYFVFLCLLFSGTLSAQDYIQNFEEDCSSNDDEFFEGCVPEWISTGGSPNIAESYPGLGGAYEGNSYAHLYAFYDGDCDEPFRSETIALNYSFLAGVEYDVSIAIRSVSEVSSIQFILTDGFQNTDGGSFQGSVVCSDLGDVLPDIPSGSQIVKEYINFDNQNWVVYDFSFIPNQNHSQLWIRPREIASNLAAESFTFVHFDAFTLNAPCLDVFAGCEAKTDLTACGEEGDFGYITLDCGVQYDWNFPSGSQAVELSSGNQSIVLNADEGIYSVTITNAEGCTEARQYEIVADCCDPVPFCCQAPTSPRCSYWGEDYYFLWDPVPGATNYKVTFYPNDPGGTCGCSNPGGWVFSVNVSNNYYLLPDAIASNCYSWTVSTDCGEGTFEESVPACYSPQTACEEFVYDGLQGNTGVDLQTRSDASLEIFPNPSSGQVSLSLQVDQPLDVEVKLFDMTGRLVHAEAPQHFADGFYLETLQLGEKLQAGTYLVFLATNAGTFQKKVVITK